VDVSSGVEAWENGKQLKGIKDAIRIREFVAAVQAADANRLSKNIS
jgi:phosphoribosylanthranilate isomerase